MGQEALRRIVMVETEDDNAIFVRSEMARAAEVPSMLHSGGQKDPITLRKTLSSS